MKNIQNPYLDEYERVIHLDGKYLIETGDDEYMEQQYEDLVAKGLCFSKLKHDARMQYAYSIPSEEFALEIKKRGYSIIEIGAGTGYWGWYWNQFEIPITCYDIDPPEKVWYPIQQGSWDVLNEADPSLVLMLCWPYFKGPHSYKSLKTFRGNTVIYVGEGQGGTTGTDEYHELLGAEWIIEEKWFKQVNWPDISSFQSIWHRKSPLTIRNG